MVRLHHPLHCVRPRSRSASRAFLGMRSRSPLATRHSPRRPRHSRPFTAFPAFAPGCVARPFGGVVFSRIGERRGVKTSLFRMLMRIGASTFALGLLPAYARAGFRSPAALVARRPLRDIASGGERRGGVQTISKNAPADRHGHYAAWSQLGAGGARDACRRAPRFPTRGRRRTTHACAGVGACRSSRAARSSRSAFMCAAVCRRRRASRARTARAAHRDAAASTCATSG